MLASTTVLYTELFNKNVSVNVTKSEKDVPLRLLNL